MGACCCSCACNQNIDPTSSAIDVQLEADKLDQVQVFKILICGLLESHARDIFIQIQRLVAPETIDEGGTHLMSSEQTKLCICGYLRLHLSLRIPLDIFGVLSKFVGPSLHNKHNVESFQYEHRGYKYEVIYHEYDTFTATNSPRKWQHQFEYVASAIYVSDIAQFDEYLMDDSGSDSSFNFNQTKFIRDLLNFSSFVNSYRGNCNSLMLFMTGCDLLRQKFEIEIEVNEEKEEKEEKEEEERKQDEVEVENTLYILDTFVQQYSQGKWNKNSHSQKKWRRSRAKNEIERRFSHFMKNFSGDDHDIDEVADFLKDMFDQQNGNSQMPLYKFALQVGDPQQLVKVWDDVQHMTVMSTMTIHDSEINWN